MTNATLDLARWSPANYAFAWPGMVACALAVAMIFAVDAITPRGVGASFLYVFIVWVALMRATDRQIVIFAVVCSALTVSGLFFFAKGAFWAGAASRFVVLFTLWGLVYFGLMYRKAVFKIRESEELLRVTFDTAPVGINIVSRDGRVLKANAAYQCMMGFTEEELRRKTTFDLTHHDDLSRNRMLREELLEGRRDFFEIEKRNHTKDGGLIWVRTKVSVVKDGLGKLRFTVGVAQDITEPKRAERILAESEERYRFLYEANPMPMWIARGETLQIVAVNDAAVQLYGYTRDEFDTMTSFHFQSEDTLTAYKDFVKGRQADLSTLHRRGRHRKKDGSIIDVDITSHPISYAGSPARLVLAQDITERLKAESALREHEELLRITFDTAPVGICIVDMERRFMRANAAYQELVGYTEEELHAKTTFELNHPDDTPRNQTLREELLEQKRDFYEIEKRYRTKKGDWVWVQNRVSLVKDACGNPRFTVAIVQDITERKRAEEKLRESEDRYRDLVEHSQDLICTHDLDGRILSVNPWAAKVLGYEQAELLNMNLRDVLASSVRHKLDGYLAAMRTDGAAQGLMLVQSRAGEKRVWEYNNTLRTEGVSTPIVRGMAHDITERKRAERELQRQAALAGLLGSLAAAANKADTPEQALAACLERICAYGGWNSGDVLRITRDGDAWRAAGMQWHFTDVRDRERFNEFFALSTRAIYGNAAGVFIDQVIATRTPRWIPDLDQVRCGPRLTWVRRAGVRSAFAFPVIVHDEVVACVEFFCAETREPDAAFIEGAGDIASHLARVIEREQSGNVQARLAAIVETATVAIITRTLDGTILSWNPGAEKMLGYTAAEAIGQSIYFTLPPGRPPNLARNNENLLRGEVVARESDCMTKDGRVIDVLTSHSPVRDGAGNIVGASVILQDIAALKEAQAALKESEQRFRAIFDYAGVGITMRPAQSRNHPWVQVNDHFCKLLGYTREELLELSTTDITPADEQARAVKNNERLLRGEIESYVREQRVVRKDGSEIWVMLAVAALPDAEGQLSNIISVYQDITERKRAERELQRQAALAGLLESLAAAANKADAPEHALAACLERICAYGGWNSGDVLQITRDGDAWRAAGMQWHFTDARARERFSEFFTLSTQTIFGNAAGVFIDQVILARAPQWIPDLDQVKCSPRLTCAREAGVRAAFAFPIIVRDEVAACVEFFCAEAREPDAAFMEATGDIASHLARVIERERSGKVQAHLAAIVETSPDAIVSRALDGTILSWNRGAERMFGYSAAEVVGKNALIIPEDYIAETERNQEFVNAGNTLSQFETARITRDGRRIQVAVSAAPIVDAGGKVTGVAAIVRDITDRLRAEAERSYLLNVLEASVNETYLFDAETLRFEYVNQSGLNNLGYSLEQMRDMTPVDLKREFTEASFREMLGPLLRAEKKVHMFRSAHRRADGSSYPVDVHLQLVERGDRRVFLAVVLDVTERKRAEEERTRYLNRLRALSRRLVEIQETERRRLAAELHDRIGQNLTALTINLNIVSSQLPPRSAKRHAARLEDSRQLVETTIETVRNVISELRPTVLDDYGLRAALRWYGRLFEKRSGVLTKVEGEDLLPRPRSEVEAALYRIAQEALNNTLKHARARCATLRLDADAARVTLTVADDGAGFDPASVEQYGEHPGWGLLMMRERAESVGGRIKVESALAHGTRVVVDVDRRS